MTPSGHHSNVRLSKRASAGAHLADMSEREPVGVPCFKVDLVARLRSSLPDDDTLVQLQSCFAALADRTRLKILHALLEADELCVCDVAHVVGMSLSSASHHLRKLRDLRILRYRTDGKMSYYSLRDRGVGALVRQGMGLAA